MKNRIVLSLLFALGLAGAPAFAAPIIAGAPIAALAASQDDDAPDAAPEQVRADDAGPENGIGTSPSIEEPACAPPAYTVPEQVPSLAGLPIIGIIVAWATSKEGLAVLSSIALWLWRRGVKDDKRRQKLGSLAAEAFAVAEKAGLYEKLDGRGKYKVFVETVVDALAADKAPALTAQEMQVLTELAKRRAWLSKPTPAAPAPG